MKKITIIHSFMVSSLNRELSQQPSFTEMQHELHERAN